MKSLFLASFLIVLSPSAMAYLSHQRVQACLERDSDNYILYHNIQANLENYLKVQLRADFLNKMQEDFRMAADCPEMGKILRRYAKIVATTIGQIDLITTLGVIDLINTK